MGAKKKTNYHKSSDLKLKLEKDLLKTIDTNIEQIGSNRIWIIGEPVFSDNIHYKFNIHIEI